MRDDREFAEKAVRLAALTIYRWSRSGEENDHMPGEVLAYEIVCDSGDESTINQVCEMIAGKLLGPGFFTTDGGETYISADGRILDMTMTWPEIMTDEETAEQRAMIDAIRDRTTA